MSIRAMGFTGSGPTRAKLAMASGNRAHRRNNLLAPEDKIMHKLLMGSAISRNRGASIENSPTRSDLLDENVWPETSDFATIWRRNRNMVMVACTSILGALMNLFAQLLLRKSQPEPSLDPIQVGVIFIRHPANLNHDNGPDLIYTNATHSHIPLNLHMVTRYIEYFSGTTQRTQIYLSSMAFRGLWKLWACIVNDHSLIVTTD